MKAYVIDPTDTFGSSDGTAGGYTSSVQTEMSFNKW